MKAKNFISLLLILPFLLFQTCKDPDKQMAVSTGDVTDIFINSAKASGTIVDLGEGATQHGHCYGLDIDPLITGPKTELDAPSKTGNFISDLTNLEPRTTYYVRAYISRGTNAVYGENKEFTTKGLALISTSDVSEITFTGAKSGGNISDVGGIPVTARGVCWNDAPGPTLENHKTVDGAGEGSFISTLTGLIPGTLYYVRAYATNGGGTAYGNEVSFTTPCPQPQVLTEPVINLTFEGVTLRGIVNANGAQTEASFEYGATLDYGTTIPAKENPVTGNTETAVSANIGGLLPLAIYHYRVKAASCGGTVYGDDRQFETPCPPPVVMVNPATGVGVSTAILNAVVNARNYSTDIYFEYGPTTAYGNTVTPVPGTINTGIDELITVAVSGLLTNTVYHYRLVATSCGGKTEGNDQEFATASCPGTVTLTHSAGNVAPVTKTLTYGVVETDITGQHKCWITRNLGADRQALGSGENTEAPAGWYWQFNRKQGYMHDGTTRTPGTTWIYPIDESSDWTQSNDPCAILLGAGWRIPTQSEWFSADNNGGWNSISDAYASILKLHAAGSLMLSDGSLTMRGSGGVFWSSVQWSNTRSWALFLDAYTNGMDTGIKSQAFTLRCLKD